MIHARKDYQRIQDPENKIGEDEPVFLIRAKDFIAADVVTEWAKLHLARGGDVNIAASALAHARLIRIWQTRNGCKLADMPGSSQEITVKIEYEPAPEAVPSPKTKKPGKSA